MARRGASVVLVPTGGGGGRGSAARTVVIAGGRAAARAAGRAAARAAAWAAREEEHRLWALGGALVLGLARRFGVRLPRLLPGVSPALGYGLVAWALGRMTRGRVAEHMATGLLSVGVYEASAYTRATAEQVEELLEAQDRDEVRGGAGRVVVGEE